MKSGDIYPTNKCGDLKVVEYFNSASVLVEFVSTGSRKTAAKGDVIRGLVKDPYSPSVYGVGFVGRGNHKAYEGGRKAKSYIAWNSMMSRCYSLSVVNIRPSYLDCHVSECWHEFQAFAEWFACNHIEGCELDKDVLIKGSRVYSPESCAFIHKKVNGFVVDRSAGRGELMLGVCLTKTNKKNKFKSSCSNPFTGKQEHLGYFNSEKEAHEVWRERKHELSCQLADSDFVTDERIAEALRRRYE